MQTKRYASHVLYHGISPTAGADFPDSMRLAKGEAVPLPFDPSLAGRLPPLHPDPAGGRLTPADQALKGHAATMAELVEEAPDALPGPAEPERRPAPWRGRKRAANPLSAVIHIRCTPDQQAAYEEAASRAGLSVGEYFRMLADGKPSVRAARRPAVEKTELARVLGLLGNLTSNVNQLARAANSAGFDVSEDELTRIAGDVRGLRSVVMKALGYGD